jgi:hypothetical protein
MRRKVKVLVASGQSKLVVEILNEIKADEESNSVLREDLSHLALVKLPDDLSPEESNRNNIRMQTA